MEEGTLQSRLKRLRLAEPVARAVFSAARGTSFTPFRSGESSTEVSVLANQASVTEKQVREVLSKLQRYGFGTLILGRHRNPTRFQWKLRPSLLPDRQPGEPDPAAPLEPEGGEVLLRSQYATVWVVHVSDKRFAHVLLPPKPSARDVEAIRDYCDAHLDMLRHQS